ncbi:serine hydrolase [Mitsuaria sp. 7]|uniref:serine hydrolase domain-containing protein n=1 Tax=Mitsuaria sp. 7 TaxID=1658665 RepID=UPI0008316E55|nr:serine hydrolase [Mitsuaria sp. 7]
MVLTRLARMLPAAVLLSAITACQAPAPTARGGADFASPLAAWEPDAGKDQDKTLQGVVVLRDGRVVAERYYNGATAASLNDIRSAGKSVTGLLATIALDRGAIASASDPVRRYWPEAAGSALGDATVDDLLTMRSGLAADDEDPTSPGIEDHMDESSDPVAFALSTPRQEAPGTTYRYNSLTAYAAGIVVGRAAGADLGAFAGPALFEPLGITAWRWDKDVAGHTKGQGNLWLSTRSLAAIGELVRCGGEYRGRRLVSAGGIEAMLRPRVAIGDKDPYADQYGRFWYFKALPVGDSRVPVWFASGNGGNKIYVVPHLRMVVAITSQAYGRGYGQRRSQEILTSLLRAAIEGSGKSHPDSSPIRPMRAPDPTP